MPPDPLVKAVNAGDVKPDTRDMPAERVRMVERGHYLYSVSCAICHGTDGSGGTPISWRPARHHGLCCILACAAAGCGYVASAPTLVVFSPRVASVFNFAQEPGLSARTPLKYYFPARGPPISL